MPYIKKEDKRKFTLGLNSLRDALRPEGSDEIVPGELNYVISRLLSMIEIRKYAHYNTILGVLEAVKQEYYRRTVGPYEEEKRLENGELWWEE